MLLLLGFPLTEIIRDMLLLLGFPLTEIIRELKGNRAEEAYHG